MIVFVSMSTRPISSNCPQQREQTSTCQLKARELALFRLVWANRLQSVACGTQYRARHFHKNVSLYIASRKQHFASNCTDKSKKCWFSACLSLLIDSGSLFPLLGTVWTDWARRHAYRDRHPFPLVRQKSQVKLFIWCFPHGQSVQITNNLVYKHWILLIHSFHALIVCIINQACINSIDWEASSKWLKSEMIYIYITKEVADMLRSWH